MSLEAWILIITLCGMTICFFTEWLRMDVTAFIGLAVVMLSGLLTPEEAFSGFSSAAVVTLVSVYFISVGLRETGLADYLASLVLAVAGNNEYKLVLGTMVVAAFFSAFMNNTATVALLLPSVMTLAARASVSPSLLCVPLAWGAILGGMTTLIGTPPNIIASDILRMNNIEPLKFLDFTPRGLLLCATGIIFMIITTRLWPRRVEPSHLQSNRDLTQLYQLFERVFLLRVPEGSKLAGKSLAESRLGSLLGAQVIAIMDGAKTKLSPHGTDILVPGSTLIIGGRIADLGVLKRFQDVTIELIEDNQLFKAAGHEGARLEVVRDFPERTLAGLEFGKRHHVVVVGIERGDDIIYRELSQTKLQPKDILLVVGEVDHVAQLPQEEPIVLREKGLPIEKLLGTNLFSVHIPVGASIDGLRLKESRFGELLGLTIIGLVRHGEVHFAASPDEHLIPDDQLLVVGEQAQVERLRLIAELEIVGDPPRSSVVESNEVGVVEMLLPPRSKLIGATLQELNFRERYDFQVLGLWREGRPIRARLSKHVLKLGDALLLQGPRNKIQLLSRNPDFVVLSEPAVSRRPEKAAWVLGALGILIFGPALGLLSVQVAAFLSALLVVLGRAVRMEEGYREVEWKVAFFVAALLPFGLALERTGITALVTSEFISYTGHTTPLVAVLVLTLLASAVSQVLDGSLAMVLVAPIAIKCAQTLGLDPRQVVMLCAMSASIAFITPFSQKASLLVLTPGGYRTRDFVVPGTLLSVILFILLLAF